MMKTNLLSPKKLLITACLILVGFSAVNAQVEVPFAPRLSNNGNTYLNIKGDYTFLANGILNRVNNNNSANDPYNGTANNNGFYRDYIDVDNDNSTFSSSSSTLNIPFCSKIAYAGLYWAGNYQQEVLNNTGGGAIPGLPAQDPRRLDFTTVKLRVPGGSYVDVTADNNPDPVGEEDQIIYDNVNFKDSPYICYANVTQYLQAMTDPNGEYFVGNIRATRGRSVGGAGGWTLVVIYENPTLPGRYIATFDGYSAIVTGGAPVSFDVSGFNTIPVGPVRGRLGASVLEGDRSLRGDTFRLRAFSNGTSTILGTTPANGGQPNPQSNFFDSNITIDNAHVTTRNIASQNTLGYDADIFELNNPANSVIPNGETGAELTLTTSGDSFGAFLLAFAVEIIEPDITLSKTVEDGAGNDISGAGINLGQEIVYVLRFQNRGNDDATNYRIRDVLPINVDFPPNGTVQPGDIIVPAPLGAGEQITWTYDAASATIEFDVPDGYVEVGDPEYEIRLKVRVVNSCNELRDACSNIVQNQAFSYYEGVINDNEISDDPSFAGFDNCDFGIPGSTNFLTDIDDCDFTRNEILCGTSVVLEAGSGFLNYQWRDSNGNILQDGPSNTLTVTQVGTYVVTKTAPAPCLSFDETINVVLFGNTATNPIIPYADEVVTCPNDGDDLPKIFLCGGTDSRFLDTNITDSQDIVWQRLDESSCPPIGIENCANKNQNCTWVDLKTGNDYTVNDAGQYRLVVNYQNGCFNRFYFNVTQNLLTPDAIVQDIVCNTPGSITVTNVPADYEYSLNPSGPYQDSPVFNIPTAGTYTIYIRQKNVAGNICIFTLPNVDVRNRDFTVDLIPEPVFCLGQLGSVRVQVNDVEPQYYFEIAQGGTTIDSFGPSGDNDYTFDNLNPGTYTVTATTDDGCSFTGDVTIENFSDLSLTASVSQNITCREGNIQMNPSGGQSPYNYAIWSYNGTDLYASVNDIPSNQFQTSVIFDIAAGNEGTYEFVVVDRNNCFAISNPVTIIIEPDVEYTIAANDISCAGLTDGSIIVTITNSQGYKVDFDLQDNGGNVIASNDTGTFTGLSAGDYTVVINQQKGNQNCSFPFDYTINDATPIEGEAEVTQFYTCNTPDGIVSIVSGSVSGGNAPYQYSIDGVNYGGATSFSGLLPGDYTIYIRDANGCVTQTNTVNIPANSEPTDLTFTVPQVTCDNGKVVDVVAVATGGVAPLTYEITSPASAVTSNNDGNFIGLLPNTYTFIVTDANGCSYTENLTISDITEVSVVGSLISNVTCLGDTDGELLFTVNSPNTFDYTITGPSNSSGTLAPGNNVSLSGLGAGTYTITVTDTVTNCSDTDSVTINGPPAELEATLDVIDVTCSDNGSVIVNATGGWGGYSYRLTQPDATTIGFQASNTFNNLTQGGTYTVTIRDTNGCEIQETFSLTAAVVPVLTIAPNDICYDPSVGLTITATITSGGTAPFQYRINGGAYQNSNVFAGLTPGSYTVEVTDTKNCTANASITVNPALTASAVLTKDLDCSATPDAIIDITANDGYPGYTYEVSFNSGAFTAIAGPNYTTSNPGDYTFRVTDLQGCAVTTNVITVNPADLPLATAAVTNQVSCDSGADGEVTITIDASVGAPPYLISFNGGPFTAQTVYAGLTAQTYNYTVRDSKECEQTFAITLNPANPITATAIIDTEYTCTGDGAITIQGGTASGGTGSFEYSLDGVNFQPTPLFSGLTDGTYTITVRDTNGCTFVTNPVTLDPLNEPTNLNFTASPVQCPALTTDVTVSVVDGNAPFTFEIIAPTTINNGNSDTFTGLAPGTYTFLVTDAKGCTIQEDFTIDDITPINVTAQIVSDEVCFGANDGSLSFTVSNFTGTYNYQVINAATTVVASGTSSNTTETITGLAPDDYTIVITDNAYPFCTDTSNVVTIAGPTAALAFTTNLAPLTCIDDAVLTVNATDGWGGYTYQLDNTATAGIDVPYSNNNTFAGLTAGTYDIFVQDARGCIETQSITITAPVLPTVTIAADTFCYDATTGVTITATAAGGNTPYEYSLNGGAFQTANTFTGLAPGSYTVEVRDDFGCTATSNTIVINDALTASAVLTKDLDCSATPDAIIDITANDGYPGYTYEVSFNSGAFTAIAGPNYTTSNPGDYTFRVTDLQGCAVTTNVITVNPADLPLATAAVTNQVSCDSGADGEVTITIDASVGAPPYLISFNGGPFTAQTVYAGLTAQTYNYTVRDSKECEQTFAITLNPANPITATAIIDTEYTCTGDGAITIQGGTASGGTGSFEYSLDGVNFQPTPLFSGLTDGTYTITVRDTNGCTFVTNPVTLDPLNEPTNLNFTASPVQCPALTTDVTVSVVDGNAPFTFEIIAPTTVNNGNSDTFTGLAPGTYTFLVTDAKGCTIQEDFTIDDITPINVTAQIVSDEVCFGANDGSLSFTVSNFTGTYNYQVINAATTVVASGTSSNTTETITGLAPDDYTIVITDNAYPFCTDTSNVVTIAGPTAALAFTTNLAPLTCIDDAVLTVNATDGWGGYTYQLDNTATAGIDVPYSNNNTFAGLTAGTYDIFVQDARGCIETQSITITAPVLPTVTIAADTFCYDATTGVTITATAAGGNTPYEYSLNGGAFQTANTFTGLAPGSYTVEVRDDFGCTATSNTIVINDALTASAVLTKDLDCSATPDATIDITANDGYPGYTYEVSFNSGAFTAIAGPNYTTSNPGDYTFRVTDLQGCQFLTNTVTVAPITNPNITSVVQTQDILCNGDSNASIDITFDTTVGTPPFVINVFNTTTGTDFGTQTSGLPAGDYTITITDSKQCTDSETITIAQPDPIAFDITTVDISCNNPGGTSFGEIRVENVTGGTAEYVYTVTNNLGYFDSYTTTAGGEDHSFQILTFGVYEVDVVDANGCSLKRQNIVIASPPDDLIIDVSTSTANCAAGATAIVQVNSTSTSGNPISTGPFFFAIFQNPMPLYPDPIYQPADNPGTDPYTSTFTGLIPGISYTFVVYDSVTDCYYFEQADTPLDTPTNLTSTIDDVNNVSCTGNADGNVSFTIDNFDSGATAVNYEIYNAQTNTPTGQTGTITVNPPTGPVSINDFGALAPGLYFILFEEVGGAFAGCTVGSEEFTITQSSNLLDPTVTLIKNDNCNLNAGEISATAQFGTAPYEFQLTNLGDPAPTAATWAGSTTSVFNVEGGDYVLYVKDANDCIQFEGINVPTDPSPEITLALLDQCTAADGGYTVTVTRTVNGIAPYSYSIDGGTFQTNNNASFNLTNLSSGTHTVTIQDANGCGETQTIDIFPPIDIQGSITAEVFCDPANAGEVTLTASGGSGNYQYRITAPVAGAFQASNVFGSLADGTYTFEVEDTTTNCTDTVTITLEAPAPVDFSLAATDVSCFGGADGTITVTLNATDDPPFLYSLDGGTTTQTDPFFNGLTAGTYNVTVISAKGCEDTQSIIIDEPADLSATASSTIFTCNPADNSQNDAQITVTPAGGTAPYLFSIDGVNFVDNGGIFNVSADATYTITVRDANGCTFPISETVAPIQRIAIDNIDQVQALDCTQPEIIEIIVSGGSGNYEYVQLPSGTPQASNQFTLTGAGTYTFRINDLTTGCFDTETYEILPNNVISVSASLVQDVTCFGGSDGELSLTTADYTGTYDYFVLDSGGATVASGNGNSPETITITGLPVDTYTIRVVETQVPFCEQTTNAITISSPDAPVAVTASATLANCNVGAIITAAATGGNGTYEYSIVPQGNPAGAFVTDNFLEVNPATYPATYTVYVRDAAANICTAQVDITVDTDPDPTITVPAFAADQCTSNGTTYTFTATGTGVAPLQYSIDGVGFQNSGTFTISAPGTYTVTVRDANGCTVTDDIIIYPPIDIQGSITAEVFCDPANAGEVTLTASGGSGNYQYRITAPVAGAFQASNVFGSLADGTYTFEVEDTTTNCTDTVTITLETPAPVDFSLAATDVSCFGGADGTITVTLNATDDPPFLYSLDGGTTTQTDPFFNGLTAGTYNVTVISAKGCEDTQSIIIDEPADLSATASSTIFTCNPADNSQNDAQITVTPAGGTAPYLFSIDGVNFVDNGGVFNVSADATYTITVRDANGCIFPISETVAPIQRIAIDNIDQVQALDCTQPEIIEIIVSGGSGDYSYTQLPSGAAQASNQFTLTTPGTYSFRVDDNITGCFDTVTYEIVPFDLITVSASLVQDVTCFGGSDGELSLTTADYTGTYDYFVLDSGGATVASGNGNAPETITITGLPVGNFTVRVVETQVPFCDETTNVVTISSPDAPVAVTASATLANCNVGAIITAAATGGNGTYEYSIVPQGNPAGTFVTDNFLEVNPATYPATYTVYVRDAAANICTAQVDITVDTDPDPTITVPAFAADQCTSDGTTYTFTATGTGVAPLQYSIDGVGFQNSGTFTVSAPGTYTVTVRDANGCTVTDDIIIYPPVEVTVDVDAQPSCANTDGSITATGSGGSGNAANYQYTLLDGGGSTVATGNGASFTFTNLVGGVNYTVVFEDTTVGAPACTANDVITLEIATPVTLLATDKTDITCNGDANGSITINLEPDPANDNPPYTFIIDNGVDPAITQTTNVFTGLNAGTYTITVTSNRNCVGTDTVIINEPLALDAAITNVTDFACDPNNEVQTASIEITITSGTGTAPYSYSVNGGGFIPTGADVFVYTVTTAGTYDFVIRDDNGCTFTVPTQTIDPLPVMTAVDVMRNPSAANGGAISCDNPEEVIVTVTGGSGDYTFDLLPVGGPAGNDVQDTPNGDVDAIYQLATVGTYVFRVFDDVTGCYIDSAPYEVAPFDEIVAIATAITPVTCYSDANGEITLEIQNYTGGYNYIVFDDSGTNVGSGSAVTTTQNPITISGLPSGNLYVAVEALDAPFCDENSNVVTIASPDRPLDATLTATANVTCTNDQGAILVDGDGGWPLYDIVLLNNTTSQSYNATDVDSFEFTGLSAGSYTATITDDRGCVITRTIDLIEPPLITATAVQIDMIMCEGDVSATIEATATGGRPSVDAGQPYRYILNYLDGSGNIVSSTAAQLSNLFTGLGAGSYSVTVIDGWDCDATSNQVDIVEPTQVVASLAQETAPTCLTDGSVTLTATGGVGPYSYGTDGTNFTGSFASSITLPAPVGTYRYYVRDANMCISELSNQVTIDPIPDLEVIEELVVDVNCNGETTGLIQVKASGGLGNYVFTLYQSSDLTTPYRPAQSEDIFSGLPAGGYRVVVDSNDCTDFVNVLIEEGMPLTARQPVVNNPLCTDDLGSITIELEGGTGQYQFAISPNLNEFQDENTFDELPPGMYTIIAQDTQGCKPFIFQREIIAPDPLAGSLLDSASEACTGDVDGFIEIDIAGGTAPYSTKLVSNNPNLPDMPFELNRVRFDDLEGGYTYVVLIEDANGCESQVVVELAAGVVINPQAELETFCDNNTPTTNVDVTVNPDVANDVIYFLDGDTNGQLDGRFENLSPGDHTVLIQHANGCQDSITFTVPAVPSLGIVANEGGINEIVAEATGGEEPYEYYFNDIYNGNDNTFVITQTGTYTVRVVDANGCEAETEIFMEFIDIFIPNFFTPDGDGNNDTWSPKNTESFPDIVTRIYDRYGRLIAELRQGESWLGTYDGSELPTGDYWYVVKLNADFDGREFVGNFTLYR
ncbi:T9SS type B sorting domain-containing protein [Flavobacteriaceae bacterium M23B6Z8]